MFVAIKRKGIYICVWWISMLFLLKLGRWFQKIHHPTEVWDSMVMVCWLLHSSSLLLPWQHGFTPRQQRDVVLFFLNSFWGLQCADIQDVCWYGDSEFHDCRDGSQGHVWIRTWWILLNTFCWISIRRYACSLRDINLDTEMRMAENHCIPSHRPQVRPEEFDKPASEGMGRSQGWLLGIPLAHQQTYRLTMYAEAQLLFWSSTCYRHLKSLCDRDEVWNNTWILEVFKPEVFLIYPPRNLTWQ